MGTDITLHTEVKIAGKWHHYSVPNIPANYQLFARMAGVRNVDNEIEPISLPRGLPADVTELTDYCFEIDGGDCPSWLSSAEVIELQKWCELNLLGWIRDKNAIDFWFDRTFGSVMGTCWSYLLLESDDKREVEDFRFVFWFD